jgi:hypothetical protein
MKSWGLPKRRLRFAKTFKIVPHPVKNYCLQESFSAEFREKKRCEGLEAFTCVA